MGIEHDIAGDWHAALAALAWQVDLGLTDISAESPLNRYDLPEPIKAPPPTPIIAAPKTPTPPPEPETPNPDAAIFAARAAASQCETLEALREALASFEHCELKRGARNLVFADGNPKARVLILGEAPGVEEDREGRPFVGREGQLLDKMFAAIGLSRTAPDPETAIYITNSLPWRPPQNRDPSPDEIAMMRPFVERHIALINPDVIVLVGNTPLQTILNTKDILRARGNWTEALGKLVLPMTHPAYLLRNPIAKREAWADLLSLHAKLRG
ncbi:uracil-DNA glycosylase family protein [Cypionkella sp.]|uniref:uracil-DNA glycosylase n=1 Tax=Cypionkella sp. TaxID=2811411 RepID=UPI00271D91EE|nr:uracil-DNA glycosylase [Cypionkella sp.]MDO8983352.1 uracil-DNA glycosylase [Cypionkella sp.]MDP2050195.1 uracil-DNA glycosylase [Cypionkella sp.]